MYYNARWEVGKVEPCNRRLGSRAENPLAARPDMHFDDYKHKL